MSAAHAAGLRHEDLDIAEPTVAVVTRVNDNRARAKGGRSRFIPASGELMRLYADYLNVEYGPLDSEYVFVNRLTQTGIARSYSHPVGPAENYLRHVIAIDVGDRCVSGSRLLGPGRSAMNLTSAFREGCPQPMQKGCPAGSAYT
jgi:hypothetical protein